MVLGCGLVRGDGVGVLLEYALGNLEGALLDGVLGVRNRTVFTD